MKEIRAMLLRLELNTEGADMETMRAFARVREGITRDIVVPADLTLHALHYVIQRAFGWGNSHSHRFYPEETVTAVLTGGSFRGWKRFCGVYYRFPMGEDADRFWDEDYEGGDHRAWLRKKYTGPYVYGGFAEHFLEMQDEMRLFCEKCPEVDIPDLSFPGRDIRPGKKKLDALTMEETDLCMEEPLDSLLERLPVGSLLAVQGKAAAPDEIQALGDTAMFEYKKSAALSDAKLEELEKAAAEDAFELEDIAWEVLEISAAADLPVLPIADTLNYEYDYGDGWELKIRCLDTYTADKDGYAGSDGSRVSGEIADAIQSVLKLYRPVCVALDGMNVMDDVGGIGGFCDFLQRIHGSDASDSEEAMEWALEQGWNPRMPQKRGVC